MKNGSRLVGKLVSAESDVVVFKTPFTDNLTIKEENIDRMVTDETVTIMLDDGAIYRDRLIDSTEVRLVAKAEGQDPVVFDTTDIKMINPAAWKLGEGHQWSGSINAALESERGNSDSDEWDIKAKTVLLSVKDRYTFDGDMEREESNGIETSDNWAMSLQYDRFVCFPCKYIKAENRSNPKNYYGAKVRFEYDQFADLDLRTIIGPHLGRQFFNSKIFSLELEAGPVWVDEKFNQAQDNEYPGALWSMVIKSDVLGFGSTLYVDHDGILNFDKPGNLLLNTTTGIKFPLLFGLETGVEVEWEYDGGAVEGVDELDETYNFRIGYTW